MRISGAPRLVGGTEPLDLFRMALADNGSQIRNAGGGSFMATCPAHDDRNPSLSVKATSEGDVLLYCFAGCSIDDVLATLNLTMSALFPAKTRAGSRWGL